MPIISAELVRSGGMPSAAELEASLLAGQTLLSNTAEHLIEVVDVLESYGQVLDAYSKNLIFQAEQQFLLPFPLFKYLDGDKTVAKIWRHLNHDRINFEYAEYCMKAMLWHGTGGLDAYLDSEPFAANCRAIIGRKTRRDPLLALLAEDDPRGCIASARPYPGQGRLELELAPTFLALAGPLRQQQADQWLERSRELGYERLRLLDGSGALLAQAARVGSGMVLLGPASP